MLNEKNIQNSWDWFYGWDAAGQQSVQMLPPGNTNTPTAVYMAQDAYGKQTGSIPSYAYTNGFGARWGSFAHREVGLVQMGFRFYDEQTGRWLNRDPIGQSGGLNLYEYANNNPTNYFDATGRNPLLVSGAFGALIGGTIGGLVAWYNGEDIWSGVGKGAFLGGMAGLTFGIGSGVATGLGANAFFSGVIGGTLADAAVQNTEIIFDWRDSYDWKRTVLAGGLGGAFASCPVKITRWSGEKGAPIEAGRFVMLGGPNRLTWFSAGGPDLLRDKGYQFTNYTTQWVNPNSLRFPTVANGEPNAFMALNKTSLAK